MTKKPKETINIYEEINGQSLAALTEAINVAKYDDIRKIEINMCTPGGDLEIALAMYDMIKLTRTHIVTKAWGEVASAGLIVFGAGDSRLSAAHTTFTLHEITTSIEDASTKMLEETTKEMQRLRKIWINITCKTFKNASIEDIEKMLYQNQDTALTAKEAKTLGLVDKII
jgi:ATP-dependent protease ClpP protease subunit